MRGSSRYLTGKEVTLAAFAVTDWKMAYFCPICGDSVGKQNKLCVDCQKEADAEKELQMLMDEQDLLRGAGIEPPRAVLDQISDKILYGLDDEGLDYWD